MNTAEFVKTMKEDAAKLGDGKDADAAKAAADTVEQLYNLLNGRPITSVYFTLPLMAQAIDVVVSSTLNHSKKGEMSKEEQAWFMGIHDDLENIVDKLHVMLYDGKMSDTDIDEVLRNLPDGNDA